MQKKENNASLDTRACVSFEQIDRQKRQSEENDRYEIFHTFSVNFELRDPSADWRLRPRVLRGASGFGD
jgi:hypothetical protein